MGRTLCKIHGYQPLSVVCPHVLAAYEARDKPIPCREALVEAHGVDPRDVFGVWLCADCEAALDLPADFRVDLDDHRADLLMEHPGGVICYACFEKWRKDPPGSARTQLPAAGS